MSSKDILEVTNLNSNLFEPSKYLNNFLKTNNIKNLIQKNIELQQDIKNYDQDIQSLVFENYNKFIISIETVKKMKQNILKVDKNMKNLESSMDKINNLVSKIDDNLKTKRTEIQKLDTVNKDLQKLRNLCDFPYILKSDVSDYRVKLSQNTIIYATIFDKSIKYYRNCYVLLNKLRSEPLVKPIYNDSINEIEEMRKIIWSLQNSKTINEEELRQVTKKLLIVIEDKETVLKNYLRIIKERLVSNTRKILDSHSSIQDDTLKQKEILTTKFLEEKKYDVSLDELQQFITKNEEEIANKEINKEGTCLWLISKLSQKIFPDIKQEIVFLYDTVLPILNEEKDEKIKQIDYLEKVETIVKDITMVILTSISEKLAFIKLSNMQVNDSFKKLYFEVQMLLNDYLSKNLKTEILDKFSENVEHVFRGQLFDSFSNVRCKFIELILNLKSNTKKIDEVIKEENELETIKKEIFSTLNTFKNKLHCIVSGSLIELKPFILQQDNFLKSHLMFFSLLHSQFTEFIKLIVKIMVLKTNKFSIESINEINNSLSSKFASSANNDLTNEIYKLKETKEDSSYYLIINQFLIMFEKKLLYKYFEILFELFHKNPPADQNIRQNYQSLRMNIENNEISKLIVSLKVEINKNLQNYSEFYYEVLMSSFKTYLKKNRWNGNKEPTEISLEIEKTIPIFRKILLELSILFPDLKRGFVKKNSFIKFKSPDIDMERILAKKSHHFEKNDLNRNVVLLSILKSILKGIIDHVRRLKFEKFGFQQLEIDMYFLVQICYEMVAVDDESLIIGFYFEIIQNANENSFDGIHVNQSMIENIANQYRLKLKL